MKKTLLIILTTINIFAWEINTHRAINRKAIEASQNLKTFVANSGISKSTTVYDGEQFEDYGYTYLNYIKDGENNGISNWGQTFLDKPSYQKMIESGSILEDAQWPHTIDGGEYNLFDMVHGRFVNHFYDAQNGGHALTYGAFLRTDALHWGLGSKIDSGNYGGQSTYLNSPNIYTYSKALNYFKKAFTEESPTERRKYQAKMLVSVGHLLHLMNDMTSPAHTRDDSHPFGDAMEVCGRGGESGSELKGFRVEGNTVKDYLGIISSSGSISLPDIPKYSKFSDFISQESYWVSTHFFSNDTIFTKPKPSISDTYETFASSNSVTDKYYIRSHGNGIYGCNDGCVPSGTKLGIRIRSYIINALGERYYDGTDNVLLDKTTSFQGDYSVLKDNAKLLIPRAISNARNFINYFFRGQLSAKMDGSNITIKNISNPSLMKDRHTITLSPGRFYLKYYTTGNISGTGDGIFHDFEFTLDLARYTQNIALVGTFSEAFPPVYKHGFSSRVTLEPGESIVVPIKRDTSITHKHIVVVYDGRIGDERGIAVSGVETPDIMIE